MTDDKRKEALEIFNGFIEAHNPHDPVDQQLMLCADTIKSALQQPDKTVSDNSRLDRIKSFLKMRYGRDLSDVHDDMEFLVGELDKTVKVSRHAYQELERLDGVMLKYRDEAFKLREVLKGARDALNNALSIIEHGSNEILTDMVIVQVKEQLTALNALIGAE